MVDRRGRPPLPVREPRLLEAYAGRAAMEARARRLIDKGEKSKLFEIMKEQAARPPHELVWAEALDRGQARDGADRRGRARARRGDRLRGQPARRRGGDHRRRSGRAVRPALRGADRAGDAPHLFAGHRAARRTWPASATSAAPSAPQPAGGRRERLAGASGRLAGGDELRRSLHATAQAQDEPQPPRGQAGLAGGAGARRPRHAAEHRSEPMFRSRGSIYFIVALLAINWLSVLLFEPSTQPRGPLRSACSSSPRSRPARSSSSRRRATRGRAPSRRR